MSLFRSQIKRSLQLFLACGPLLASPSFGQTETQLGFTALQEQATSLVEEGRLVEAIPYLTELIKRVDADANSEVKLDTPLYLLGSAQIQKYVNSGQNADLEAALASFDRVVTQFPNASKLKETLLRRIDIYRGLGQAESAIAEIQKILDNKYPSVRLSPNEQADLLKDLTQVYYNQGNLQAGLPYFSRLLANATDFEDRAFAAAASFEAYFQNEQIDEALKLLPQLAKESEVRYRPRLNVALLKASDILVDDGQVDKAALTLSLIKTTDLMIDFYETQLRDVRSKISLRETLQSKEDQVLASLRQDKKRLQGTIGQLQKLPTLKKELRLRRARNYTKTGRRYEAFWMFQDLMKNYPADPQAEFFTYATFSNALQVGKEDVAREVGAAYRKTFPEGEFYADVSGGLAGLLRDAGNTDQFLSIATNFLENQPQEAVSSSLYAQWAAYMIGEGRYAEVVSQSDAWFAKHKNPIYEDGIFYWAGLARLQLTNYKESIDSFDQLLSKYPTSLYTEDASLRRAVALFYDQQFLESRKALVAYTDRYPSGEGSDQAFFFLGEIEFLAGNYDVALGHFQKADALTNAQDVHDGAAFRIASLLNETGRHQEMVDHLNGYIERFGDSGNITRATLELGSGYERLIRPVEAIALFQQTIERFVSDASNPGVDSLIEGYAERYAANKEKLEATVAFYNRLETDAAYRERVVTDRGYLFEQFYENKKIDQELYNRLRKDPDFSPALADDLSPISDLLDPYRQQLNQFPEETPEAYFRKQLASAQADGDRIAETRMLMGLYRLGVEVDPSQPFDRNFVERLTPRAMLYVADYERDKRIDFAADVWNTVLTFYPTDDATIVAYTRLSELAAEENDLSGALIYLEQIQEKFPGSPRIPGVLLRQGEVLSRMERGDEAREKYQYILRVPEWRGLLHARALYQIGQSYMAESAYDKAHGFFERTFLGYPHISEWSAKAYLADAEALLEIGARQDAITTLEEAVRELSGIMPKVTEDAIKSKLGDLRS